jgi:hypothetical protein
MAVEQSCSNFLTVPLPKRPRDGRFNSETTTWIQKWFKKIKRLLGLTLTQ